MNRYHAHSIRERRWTHALVATGIGSAAIAYLMGFLTGVSL